MNNLRWVEESPNLHICYKDDVDFRAVGISEIDGKFIIFDLTKKPKVILLTVGIDSLVDAKTLAIKIWYDK